LYWGFSTPLRALGNIGQSVGPCVSSILLNVDGLLKKLLVYTEDES
jgi:hypothetical protein